MSDTNDAPIDGLADKRERSRLAILGELAGGVKVLQPITITEIGDLGVQILATFPMQLDSLQELKLNLDNRPVVVSGRVAHCSVVEVDQDIVRYRIGLEFVALPERVRAHISDYLKTRQNERTTAR